MTKTVFTLAILALACSAFAETGAPTLADPAPSVLTTEGQPAATTATPAAAADQTQAVQAPIRCETVREVRLGPWQARRLARQADRQSARDCCKCKCGCDKCDCCRQSDCCKCKCGCPKCKCRPTAFVLTKACAHCDCK